MNKSPFKSNKNSLTEFRCFFHYLHSESKSPLLCHSCGSRNP